MVEVVVEVGDYVMTLQDDPTCAALIRAWLHRPADGQPRGDSKAEDGNRAIRTDPGGLFYYFF